VKLYPNPANSYVNVNLPANSELRVINITGQEVAYQKNTSSFESLDVSNLSDGVYFVLVIHGTDMATIKLVKN
jgi:hypothetical protein